MSADSKRESEIAIVRDEDVLAALEGHRGAGLDRFVPFARRRERNLSLTVELKAAILERALHQHRAKDRDELLRRSIRGDRRLPMLA